MTINFKQSSNEEKISPLWKTENQPVEVLNAKEQEDLLKLAASTLKIELEKDKPSRDIPFEGR